MHGLQALLLPVNAASMASQAATTTCAATVTVKAGDTCYSIYTAAGITADEFAQLNPGINCNTLQAGHLFSPRQICDLSAMRHPAAGPCF